MMLEDPKSAGLTSKAGTISDEFNMDAGLPSAIPTTQANQQRSFITILVNARVLAVVAFLLGGAVVLVDRPFSHAESGDDAIYDYIAQSILRGQLPYRDVIDPKAPGSMYLSALAMAIGRSMGLRDIMAVRWLHILLMGSLTLITFLVAQSYFRSYLASLLASLVLLTIESFPSLLIRGTQPKLPMMVFGMLSLLLIEKDKPFWAGFCSMVCCLFWQPGLMFTGIALLIFSRYLTSWSDLRAARVTLGAIIPLVCSLMYFYSKGALHDLWSWTIVFPYSVFAPETAMPVRESLNVFWEVLRRELQASLIVAFIALIGLGTYLSLRVRSMRKDSGRLKSPDLFKDAIVYPPLIYLIFCLINFQGGPDLIPFYPFIGLFSGWLIVVTGRLIGSFWPKFERAVPLLALAVMCIWVLVSHTGSRGSARTLQAQDAEAQMLGNYLGPEDRIYAHGSAELLVLLDKPNLTKYIALDSGADNYIASEKAAGFQDVINELESGAPKIVVMTRLRNVRHREELQSWVDSHYDKLELAAIRGVYVRSH